MIRKFHANDMESVLDIWLSASLQAHHFVEPDFWRAHLEQMRDNYLPASEVTVFENGTKVVGFYALHGNCLAALFISPNDQGQGVGKQLLSHAKEQRDSLTLTVYMDNARAYDFYLSQGFTAGKYQTDDHTGRTEIAMVWNA